MFHSPFSVSDCNFNSPQYRLAGLAHRRAQGSHRFGGVEIEDAHEIFVAKVVFRLQATPGHEHVGNARAGSLSECRPHVVLIVLF